MKKVLLLITVLLGLSSFGWAGACSVATLSVYDTLGFSCTIGDKTFSNFTYTSAGADPRRDSWLTVEVVAKGSEQGLLFQSNWQEPPGHISTAEIGYTVTEVGTRLGDAVLGITASGHADPTVKETVGGASLLVFYDGSTNPPTFKMTDFATFPASSSVNVSDALSIGGVGGSVRLTSVFNGFSDIPEPATLTLFGSGILAIATMVRRKKA